MDSHPTFDQHRWVTRIRETLAQEHDHDRSDDDIETPVSIFSVSKSLMVTKPEAYIPQHVAIGPYHQWRIEVYEMERYKFIAARMLQEHLRGITIEGIVDHFAKLDLKIRACYDRYFDLSTETLAWMMAVDGSFVLEFLQIYGGDKMADDLTRVSSRMSQVIDYTGKSTTHNAILRDIIMLENQIPLFILKQLMGYCKRENPNEALAMMLMGLCGSLSPFKRVGDFPHSQNEILQMGHLLELLYHVCVPKIEEIRAEDETVAKENPYSFRRVFYWMQVLICSPLSRHLRRVFTSRLLKSILKFPFKIIRKIRMPSSARNIVNEVATFELKQATQHDIESNPNPTVRPLLEEIMIPSVSQLSTAGIRLSATKGDISSIKFDNISGTIHLPRITFDENTEVVLRNLVAFEATSASRAQIFTRYAELMNGIIDTEEDVKLLREKGIVINHLKSDQEVADRWNGMTRSLFLTKVAHLDKVTEEVNKYYSTRWRVIFGKLLKKYVYRSWPFLTLIAANLFLALTSLQAFCSVYDCGGIQVKNIGGVMNSTLV
ncbi:putative UPF0481 protein At3g02645 [Magnolia sinica]|uniref:putative UPF0481 protein At3g02645 n=1 Tax=Magnolia sinica TaxID=86752 RepID=UPI0026581F97|nr:putative UPF0481 protein At3g02645 [Magnolia sinica]